MYTPPVLTGYGYKSTSSNDVHLVPDFMEAFRKAKTCRTPLILIWKGKITEIHLANTRKPKGLLN